MPRWPRWTRIRVEPHWGVGMGVLAGAAFAVLLGGFQLREWLACRSSPSRRNATARNGWAGNPGVVPSTVAGRRGLIDASIVSASGLILLGLGAATFVAAPGSTLRDAGAPMTLCGLTLFALGWPLGAALGRPKWIRPWYARDEPAPWRGARREARLSDQEAWLESGSLVAEQERRVRARVMRAKAPTP